MFWSSDVLSHWRFCLAEHFVSRNILSHRMFCLTEVLSHRMFFSLCTFCPLEGFFLWTFFSQNFFSDGNFMSQDVLYVFKKYFICEKNIHWNCSVNSADRFYDFTFKLGTFNSKKKIWKWLLPNIATIIKTHAPPSLITEHNIIIIIIKHFPLIWLLKGVSSEN